MIKVRVFAPAKINLALHLTGQREDGYHLLDTLVAFADIGDWVTVSDHGPRTLSVTGPEGVPQLASDSNIMWHAASRFWAPDRVLSMALEKHLPLASGIGGGSADAAATFRGLLALRAAVEGRDTGRVVTQKDARDLLEIGADVPMCAASLPARVRGIGEDVQHIPAFPTLAIVLANPRVQVSTPAVFQAIKVKNNPGLDPFPDGFRDAETLIAWLHGQRNDLQASAVADCGEIAVVLDALQADRTCRLARMSGSGATCFGLYDSVGAARAAAETLRSSRPDWWVQAGILNGGDLDTPQVIRATT